MEKNYKIFSRIFYLQLSYFPKSNALIFALNFYQGILVCDVVSSEIYFV